jgi:hypothetical protein
MHIMSERCAGLDVHTQTVVACLLTPDGQGGWSHDAFRVPLQRFVSQLRRASYFLPQSHHFSTRSLRRVLHHRISLLSQCHQPGGRWLETTGIQIEGPKLIVKIDVKPLISSSTRRSGCDRNELRIDALSCLPRADDRVDNEGVNRTVPGNVDKPPFDKDRPALMAWVSRQGQVVIQATKNFTVKTVQKTADLAVHVGSQLYTDSASSDWALRG